MPRKVILSLFVLLFFMFASRAQQVVNAAGSTLTADNYSFEYSIGEISITTLSSGSTGTSNSVTQGVLQPTLKYVNPACEIINDTIDYFPNPTRNIVRLVSRFDWISSYRIYAADGKLVQASYYTNNQIDLSRLAAAVYFIKLFPGCDNHYRVLKVIKQ